VRDEDKSKKELIKARGSQHAPTPGCIAADCHADLAQHKRSHTPVKDARCSACHQQNLQKHPGGDNAFTFRESGQELCFQCHSIITESQEVHSPLKEDTCQVCHDPHGTDNENLLPVARGGQQALCNNCHDEENYANPHGPFDQGACTFCHNPHSAESAPLLQISTPDLCFKCHTELKKGLDDSSFVHSAVEDGGCRACHSPHGSEHLYLLETEGQALCFTCHEDKQETLDKAKSKHAAVYLKESCGTCHLPHFSKYESLTIRSEKELCMSCHGNNANFPSFTPKNMERELEGKEYIHAPVADGKCSACHNPHGAPNENLLIAPYPSSFYAAYTPEMYALCFNCHDKTMLDSMDTNGSTDFRNGSQNLHYVHVAIKRKGRTCGSCHDPHASDGPKLINRTY